MQIKCSKCGQLYNVDFSLVGRKVECVCGFKWFLREPMPQIMPARSLNEELEAISMEDIARFPKKTTQRISNVISVQYMNYIKKTNIIQEESFNDAYESLKNNCAYGNPVPGVFKEFFKLCRKKNTEDKKAKNYQSVIDRINFMLELDKKQIRILYLTYSRNNRQFTLSVAREHYSKITVTDRKNLELCKAKLSK